jgi:parvulin-like peptidyl-prolyl isomerase
MSDLIETVVDLETGKTSSKKFTKEQIAEYDTITANQEEVIRKKQLRISALQKLGLIDDEIQAIL